MSNRPISPYLRKEYFDHISKTMRNQQVEIEVAGLDIGDQIEETWSALSGISYDPRENILFITSDNFEHSIERPQEIISVEESNQIQSIFIKDSEGRVQSLKFRAPLMLDAPEKFQTI